jgi:hypothetical protein
MELLNRYLKAVESYLPHDRPTDIIRELGEHIQAQMDEHADALGRPLTDGEQAAILKQVGNPALVAGRYHAYELSVAFGRQLIGPALFPLYARVLVLATGSMLLIRMAVAVWLSQPILDVTASFLPILAIQFGIITAVFTVAQTYLSRNPQVWDTWNPVAPPTRVSDAELVSRLEAFLEFLLIGVVLLWLRSDFMRAILESPAPRLPPVWDQVYGLTVTLTATGLVPPLLGLIQPQWARFRQAARVMIGIGWVAGLAYLLAVGDWAISAANRFNQQVWYAVLVFAAACTAILLVDAARLWRSRRR